MILAETRKAMQKGTPVISEAYALKGTGPYYVTAIVYSRMSDGRITAGAKLQSPACMHSFVVENPKRLRAEEA